MPFTPLHLGPALLVGYVIKKKVHWPTFILTSLVVDVEPLLVLLGALRGYPPHGYLHTFLMGVPCGLLLGYVMYSCDKILSGFFRRLALVEDSTGPISYAVAGASGWALHLLMDSPLYPDIKPLYPLQVNPLLGRWDYSTEFLFGLLAAGTSIYILQAYELARRRYGFKTALIQSSLLTILSSLAILSLLILYRLHLLYSAVIFALTLVLIMGLSIVHVLLAKHFRRSSKRIYASFTLMTLSAVISTLSILLPSFYGRWLSALLISWCLSMIGLLILRGTVKQLVAYHKKAWLCYNVLVVAFALIPLLVGIPVVFIALLLLIAEIPPLNMVLNHEHGYTMGK